MKITQVSLDYVQSHWEDKNIYRILMCDDGNYGHSHKVARMKPLTKLTIEEYTKSVQPDTEFGFIVIETD